MLPFTEKLQVIFPRRCSLKHNKLLKRWRESRRLPGQQHGRVSAWMLPSSPSTSAPQVPDANVLASSLSEKAPSVSVRGAESQNWTCSPDLRYQLELFMKLVANANAVA